MKEMESIEQRRDINSRKCTNEFRKDRVGKEESSEGGEERKEFQNKKMVAATKASASDTRHLSY